MENTSYNTDTAELRKSFWSDAAKSGGIVGIIMVAVFYCAIYFGFQGHRLSGMIEFIVMVGVLYPFLRSRGAKYPPEQGFSLSQSIAYILAMMLFTGFVYGIAYYLQIKFLSPGMLDTILDAAVAMNPSVDENTIDATRSMLQSPLAWIFIGIFAMEIYGGFAGLFASVFAKCRPQSQQNQSDGEE